MRHPDGLEFAGMVESENISLSVVSQGNTASKPAPIKIKLPAVKFSGLPWDFASFKKEIQEIVILGRLETEIGALLSDAIPEKQKHLLRNLDLNNHTEFGKPDDLKSWVVGDRD